MIASIDQTKTSGFHTIPVPTRVCQTCGIAKSLDHFVSLYTEASTSNCDDCRKRQREVYRCIYSSFNLIYSKTTEEEKT